MTLLDGGPDLLLVYPEVMSDDGYGTPLRVPGTVPVEVRGRVQQSPGRWTGSPSGDAVLGQTVETLVRFIGRTFPAGPWAKVTWNGRDWGVVGEPAEHRGSPRTAHVTVILNARSLQEL